MAPKTKRALRRCLVVDCVACVHARLAALSSSLFFVFCFLFFVFLFFLRQSDGVGSSLFSPFVFALLLRKGSCTNAARSPCYSHGCAIHRVGGERRRGGIERGLLLGCVVRMHRHVRTQRARWLPRLSAANERGAWRRRSARAPAGGQPPRAVGRGRRVGGGCGGRPTAMCCRRRPAWAWAA